MNAVELLKYGFENAFGILGQVTADLTQEQADWTPPGTANPIGATYWHAVSGADGMMHGWLNEGVPLYVRENWQERIIPTGEPASDQRGTLEQMRAMRVSLPALHEYTQVVAQAVQNWLDSVEPADLERPFKTPIGELKVAQVLETFGIWHLNAHCGEIAALKGAQGAKGYPF